MFYCNVIKSNNVTSICDAKLDFPRSHPSFTYVFSKSIILEDYIIEHSLITWWGQRNIKDLKVTASNYNFSDCFYGIFCYNLK